MKRGLPSAPLSGHLKFSATISKDLTIQSLTRTSRNQNGERDQRRMPRVEAASEPGLGPLEFLHLPYLSR